MSLSYASDLSERVIGLAIEVHRVLGPGLLESAYEECLAFEFDAVESVLSPPDAVAGEV